MPETRPHILAITADPECQECRTGECDQECYEASVECPGVTNECRMWLACSTCAEGDQDERRAAFEEDCTLHGVDHRVYDSVLMTPTEACFVTENNDLQEAVWDLAPLGHRMPDVGRSPVGFAFNESAVELWFLTTEAGELDA